MASKIKISFFLPSLRAGGAERVISHIAQNIDNTIFETTLVVLGYEKDSKYDIKGIPILFFDQPRVSKSAFMVYQYLRSNKPDIVVSAIGHLNVMMGFISIFFNKTKFIGREVNVISILKQIEDVKSLFPKSLSKFCYQRLDKVVCQSNDMAIDIKKVFNLTDDRLIIINNPISNNFTVKSSTTKNSEILKLITVGSLAKRKGHKRILEVLKNFNIPFQYTIIGNGSEMDNIFNLADKYNIKDRIVHIEFTTNVEDYLKENDIFLQGSFVEGFPNALLESCAVGLPVLAFKAPGGINEIIEEGINGYSVESEEEFLAMLYLMSNMKWNPNVIRQSVMSKFNEKIIIRNYEQLFQSLI